MNISYVDNGTLANARFENGTSYGVWHNMRVGPKAASSFVEFRHLNKANMSAKNALILERKLEEEARDKYYKTYGQKFKTKHCFLELVVNLRKNHILKDLERVAKYVEEKFEYRATLSVIHRDEGHYEYDEQGNVVRFVANIHGHIRFCVLDSQTGKSLYTKQYRNSLAMKQLQTKVAQILNMKRGTPNPNRKNIPSRLYKRLVKDPDALALMTASVPEATKKVVEKLTLGKIKELHKEAREALKEVGAVRKNYAGLEPAIKTVEGRIRAKEPLTIQNVQNQLQGFIDAVKAQIVKKAVENVKSIEFKPNDKGEIKPFATYTKAKNDGVYDILDAARNIAVNARGLGRKEMQAQIDEKDKKIEELQRALTYGKDEIEKELKKSQEELLESLDRAQKLIEERQEYETKLIVLQNAYDKLQEEYYVAFDAQTVKVEPVEYVLPSQNKKMSTRDDFGC